MENILDREYTLLEAMEYSTAASSLVQAIKMKKFMQDGKRIEGAININRVWLIPKNAEKPADARFKNGDA